MKKLLILTSMAAILIGCESFSVSSEDADIDFLVEDVKECEVTPEAYKICQDSLLEAQKYEINGIIDELSDKIDVNNVILNHYIDEIKVEENIARVVQLSGESVTRNKITLPEYNNEPIKHTLIIQFTQIK